MCAHWTQGPAQIEREWPRVVGRAVMAGVSVGAVLGAAIGTLDWPVVGSFFGALSGAALGPLGGGVSGLVLTMIAAHRGPVWSARAATGVTWLLGALVAVSLRSEFRALHHLGVRVGVCAVCFGLGIVYGPSIALGARDLSIAGIARRIVACGAVVGAVAGGIIGFVVGLRAYAPTAPFAVGEGAILGCVCGTVLALLLVGVVLAGPAADHR